MQFYFVIIIVKRMGSHSMNAVALYICLKEKVKVKVKFAVEQATKAQRGMRGIALLFL